MRIIAGEYRGRVLKAPKGEATRPTTGRVRESLMSAIASARDGFEGAVVLDAFAGSGALGLEALSRGAAFVQFCENDSAALRIIEENVRLLGVDSPRAQISRTDVLKSPPLGKRPAFDLVFLDPPYALDPELVLGMVSTLAQAGALSVDAIIVYEHARLVKQEVCAAVELLGLSLASHKKYGDTVVGIIKLPINFSAKESQ